MYIPPPFAADDRELLRGLIRDHGFGLLITAAPTLVATHLPLEWDAGEGGEGRLLGHVSAANTQWRAFQEDAEALAVFQGPHAYISPTWYKSENMVPTWNYVAVHVRGTPRIVDDPAAAYATQQRLVETQESTLPKPWRLEDEDRERIDGLLRSIVVFETPIDQICGKAKMNQNRTLADRRGAIAGLRKTGAVGDAAVADYMARQNAEEDKT